jgi:hypothetical protein
MPERTPTAAGKRLEVVLGATPGADQQAGPGVDQLAGSLPRQTAGIPHQGGICRVEISQRSPLHIEVCS